MIKWKITIITSPIFLSNYILIFCSHLFGDMKRVFFIVINTSKLFLFCFSLSCVDGMSCFPNIYLCSHPPSTTSITYSSQSFLVKYESHKKWCNRINFYSVITTVQFNVKKTTCEESSFLKMSSFFKILSISFPLSVWMSFCHIFYCALWSSMISFLLILCKLLDLKKNCKF